MGAYEKKVFRAWWGVWLGFLLGAIFVFPNLTVGRAVWFTFYVVEMWAAFRKSDDDTLSEFAQWIASWAKPAAKWWQSWNALAFGIVVACGWHAGYVASFGYRGMTDVQTLSVGGVALTQAGPNLLFGGFVGLVVMCFLTYHFLNERRKG